MITTYFKNKLTGHLVVLSLLALSPSCQNSSNNASTENQAVSNEAGKDITLEDLRIKGMKFKNLKPHKQDEPKIHRDPSALVTYNFGKENAHLKGIYLESFTSPNSSTDEASVSVYEYDSAEEAESAVNDPDFKDGHGSILTLGRFVIILYSSDDDVVDNYKQMSDFYFGKGAVLRKNDMDYIKRES